MAIKIINKKHIKAAKMVAKVKREIRLLKYFNHPNIIRLYQVLDAVNNIFVVMVYLKFGQIVDKLIFH